MRESTKYAIAWECLLRCLRKGYNLGSWFSPIPDDEKPAMIERGLKHIEAERNQGKLPLEA